MSQRHKFSFLWGIIAPSVCTLLAWPFRHLVGNASILMIYNLGVFLVAARFGRSASILASLLSLPAFAFFFAPPIFSFAIKDIDNFVGLIVMLVVANLTSNLLDKIRLQAEIARQKESQATALYRLNMDLSETLSDQMLVTTVVKHLFAEFHVLSIVLLPDSKGLLTYPDAQPLTQSLQGVDLMLAQQIFRCSPNEVTSLPMSGKNAILYLQLQGSQRVVGVIAMQNIAPELKSFLLTYLHQIALTIERLYLAAQASAAKIQAEAEASRNSLLSAISHDLRTPLTRIVGAASTVIDDDKLTPSERIEFNRVIQDEAQRMSELVNKILDMARLAAGTIVLHREWYAIEEIIGAAISRMEKLLGDRPIRIYLPDDLPLIWIDGVLVQQVLINLLENIAKYTPEHCAVEINLELLATTLILEVVDYGPGIPIGTEEKVFEKFYRFEAESSKNGIGLGLALCRSIMEEHNGAIHAANRSGAGAVFSLILPLHQPPLMLWDEKEGA